MKNYFLKTKIFTILSIGFFVTSCNGQVKTDLLKNNGSEQKIIPNGQPKLIKNHFTDKYQEAADNVHCGLQDKAGNLWFGTTGDGVYRFDGKLFVNYTTKDGLNSNTVWSILEDKTGNIWIGTDAGVCRFDGKNINIIPINVGFISIADNKYNEYGSAKKSVWSMLQDKSGKLWFGTGEGVYYYRGAFQIVAMYP